MNCDGTVSEADGHDGDDSVRGRAVGPICGVTVSGDDEEKSASGAPPDRLLETFCRGSRECLAASTKNDARGEAVKSALSLEVSASGVGLVSDAPPSPPSPLRDAALLRELASSWPSPCWKCS